MTTSPFDQDKLDQMISLAEMASGKYRIVYEAALCSTGAMFRIDPDFRSLALSLLQDAGYTVKETAENLIVVTAAVDEVALLDAQIAALATRREKLLADRPLDDLAEAF